MWDREGCGRCVSYCTSGGVTPAGPSVGLAMGWGRQVGGLWQATDGKGKWCKLKDCSDVMKRSGAGVWGCVCSGAVGEVGKQYMSLEGTACPKGQPNLAPEVGKEPGRHVKRFCPRDNLQGCCGLVIRAKTVQLMS